MLVVRTSHAQGVNELSCHFFKKTPFSSALVCEHDGVDTPAGRGGNVEQGTRREVELVGSLESMDVLRLIGILVEART